MKTSVEQVIRKAKGTICVLSVAMAVIFVLVSAWSSAQYNDIFNGYLSLQTLYAQIATCQDEMKSYLTTGRPADLENYETALKEGRSALQALQDNPVIEEKWRFELLGNMVESFDESARVLRAVFENGSLDENYREYYDRFLKKAQLIESSSSEYYAQVIDSMKHRLETFHLIRYGSLAFAIFFGVASVWMMIWLTGFIQGRMLDPLWTVMKDMDQIRHGHYDLKQEETGIIEIDDLSEALNEMAKQIQHAIETETTNAQLEKKLALSELKMLQNQINPHFLFNTLNTIYCMCQSDQALEAGDMVLSTSRLLRYSLNHSRSQQTGSLQEELDALNCYLDIQRIRLADKISFGIHNALSPQAMDLAVPAMILQPLVENSILHGLKNYTEKGLIGIDLFEVGNEIILSVSDNGCGMELEKLHELIDQDEEEKESLGLYNVVSRLKGHYKDKVRIVFDTQPDDGFEIRICLDKSLLSVNEEPVRSDRENEQ